MKYSQEEFERRFDEMMMKEPTDEGEIIETEDLIVGQAYNGHIQVYEKATGKMLMHMTYLEIFPRERMQKIADDLQSRYSKHAAAVAAD